MNVAFRTDASHQIGTGHFMRCMTLAEKLQQHGAQILFISRSLPQYLCDMLSTNEMELAILKSDENFSVAGNLVHSHWLNTSQDQDAKATKEALLGRKWDWLIVDHYALDVRWESILRRYVEQIMVIDDIADRQHDCDVLLDHNFYTNIQERYTGKIPAHCLQLLGPRYALLREEFRKSRNRTKLRSGPIKRILIFFGGMDVDNYTGCAIETLAMLEIRLQVDVVIGTKHPCREWIEALCRSYGYQCHVQTKHMAELMVQADLAIGAGGSSMWERCCLGLPALSFCVADNQRKQITDAAQHGLIYSLSGDNFTNALKCHIGALLENEPLRMLISKTAMQEVDGFGVDRVMAALTVNDINIRNVDESDSTKLFEWRNHPIIRMASKNSAPIAWDNHKDWFAKTLADKNRILLIGEIDSQPVGIVRFDKKEKTALVSIYMVQKSDFKKRGRSLLLRTEEWLKKNHADIKSIRAEVLCHNKASQSLFINSGYQLESMYYLKEL